jgi:hypothetical protein
MKKILKLANKILTEWHDDTNLQFDQKTVTFNNS